MGRKPTEEELINRITLLENILEFYANSENYDNSSILKDGGYQARFVLEQGKKIKEFNKTILEEYKKIVETMDSDKEKEIELVNKLNNIKEKLNENKI